MFFLATFENLDKTGFKPVFIRFGSFSLCFDVDIFAFWKTFDVDILDFHKCFDVDLLGFSKTYYFLLILSGNTEKRT